ncbi:glycosyltransferase [Candidatus Pelagibacter bacterium]|nr:glycosyltransferase [Candidatus Pelagibacter bacterium]
MQTESIELGFLSLLALITFFIFLIIEKISNKNTDGALMDKDFSKPQSFHDQAISRSGGIGCFLSFLLFLGIYFLLYSQILYIYLFLGISLFLIGYLDDIKIKISPNLRLILMIISLSLFLNLFSIRIENVDLVFLNYWLENEIFASFFIVLCFLFIINGANLIDGFNGLLTINLIIINSILLFVNLSNDHLKFSFFLTGQIIILISFLIFNFPKAKIFLGDSGSYLIGSLVALNVIYTNNLNPGLSSFFYCILLFYLFFEVFFSFFRKIYQNKSPVFPDDTHLHMLIYKKINSFFGPEKSNYINSIIINLVYAILVLPSVYFIDNSLVCKYWFFSLILIYTIVYLRLYHLTKN